MEILENGEQPEIDTDVQVADAKEDNGISSVQNDGSLGKFKDSLSLLEAYNNLQAEFTKKCQKLSELEKSENAAADETVQTQDELPIFSSDNWTQKVSEFLQKNEDAKQFANEISNEILSNPSLKNNKNALELAWAKVMKNNYKLPSDLLTDDNFVENHIMSNSQIKNKIIQDYITSLEKNKLPPFVNRSQGGNFTFAKNKTANTLSEAKQLVESIFKGD